MTTNFESGPSNTHESQSLGNSFGVRLPWASAPARRKHTPSSDVEVTPTDIRTFKAANGQSLPRPTCFKTKEDWAASWVKENGMTLPPDLPEWRSLRNFFNFQLQRWKKGETDPTYQADLMALGLDFSKYRALNTGKTIRPDDEQFVKQLQDWHKKHGTYDLNNSSLEALHQWQAKLLDRFYLDGRSKRMRELQEKLPGLNFATWLRPTDESHSPEFIDWMAKANAFQKAAKNTPAFRGSFDPQMSSDLVIWAKKQQLLVVKNQLSRRQKGVLLDLHILFNSSARDQNKERETKLAMARGNSSDQTEKGTNERQLTTFLGTALFVRKLAQKCSSINIMTEFGVSPENLVLMMATIPVVLSDSIGEEFTIRHVQLCRNLYVDMRTQSSSSENWSYEDCLPFATDKFTRPAQNLFKQIYRLYQAFRNMQITQDLAVNTTKRGH